MKKYQLGEFEEVVLLTVAVLYDQAYGVSVRHEIEGRLKRKVSVSALQTALRRMEKKGFLESNFGEATAIRGGKKKRYFRVTPFGRQALEYAKDTRTELWEAIPNVAFDISK
ncbi:MAG: helix-turn-helix transcriptional regulator [Reichenbachiella sp.]